MKSCALCFFFLFFSISPLFPQDGTEGVQQYHDVWNALTTAGQIRLIQDESAYAETFLTKNASDPELSAAKVISAGEKLLTEITNQKMVFAFLSAVYIFRKPSSDNEHTDILPETSTYTVDGVQLTEITIRPKNQSWWTGYVSSTFADGDGDIRAGVSSTTGYRGYAAFDISLIPANATITACVLNYFVRVASPSSSHILQITDMNVNPVTTGGASIWNGYGSSLFNTTQMRTAGPHTSFLPVSSLQSKVGTAQWNLGFKEDGDNANIGTINGYNQSSPINCTVTYTVPAAGYLVTSPTTYIAPSTAGQTTLTIQSNIGWSVAVTGGTWASASSLSGSNSEIIAVN